jgi:hypothetical protein
LYTGKNPRRFINLEKKIPTFLKSAAGACDTINSPKFSPAGSISGYYLVDMLRERLNILETHSLTLASCFGDACSTARQIAGLSSLPFHPKLWPIVLEQISNKTTVFHIVSTKTFLLEQNCCLVGTKSSRTTSR